MTDVTVEIDGVRHCVAPAVVRLSLKRSVRFGPYFWCAFFVVIGCGAVVGSLTESVWASVFFGVFGRMVLGKPAKQADLERALRLWAVARAQEVIE